jgi:hypothetical protein
MPDIKLDNLTWDIDISSGGFQLTNDVSGETLAQKIGIALKLFKGEWFVNKNDGVPYHQQILQYKGDKALTDAILRSYILNINGVASIPRFKSVINKATRQYELTFEVVGTDGSTVEIAGVNV